MHLLDAFIDERRQRSFAWNSHDCVHFAADWVLARTGVDPIAGLRNGNRSLLETLRELRRAGGFVDGATQRLGAAIPPLTAQRGDVVLVRSGRRIGRVSGFAFGICTGTHIVVPGVERLHFMPVTAAEMAWRV